MLNVFDVAKTLVQQIETVKPRQSLAMYTRICIISVMLVTPEV